jgi:hypothetical protein
MKGFLFVVQAAAWRRLVVEAAMAPKNKRRSVMDALRDLLEKLNDLGPLLKPRELQRVPVRNPDPRRRRR